MTSIEYTFEWPAGPKEVIVTGEFDEWKGTLPLVKSSTGAFELTFPVKIPEGRDKIFFKFIVDGNWVTSDAYNKGYDQLSGIENNYISETEAEALSENPAEAKIPEAGGLAFATAATRGPSKTEDPLETNVPVETKAPDETKVPEAAGLPFVAAAANGAVKTEEPEHALDSQAIKEVTKTVDPVDPPVPTPTEKHNGPTPGPVPHIPVNTSQAGMAAAASKEVSEPEQIRFKIVRRIRKNRKTGEVTILSEEKIPLGPDEVTPEGSIVHVEETGHIDSEPTPASQPSIPAETGTGVNQSGPEENVHILPIRDPAPNDETAHNPLAGGPGPVIPNNAAEIKAFTQVRDVDAKALNERLNSEVEGTSATTLDPKTNVSISNGGPVEPAPVTSKIEAEEVKKVENEPVPADVPSKVPVTTTTATKTSKKPSPKTASPPKSEEKKKKKGGFFSKLKKVFD
ncbi:hypothetical protein HG535_0G00310 [Zygotorulaspora mrakii]|uniref:AMP-activated protein kinase glycogen-binding domain-containing protein n=1 Tax=Zygotorulaspora mrakii TaxID=42260 RepID=A0A7H9B725_ZYGMR|nr:uncharacterized protein HG535_0G00310 [Zygotorulaspora mrakii]QLG74146.1 hypothetical protein HG535_0G00310 [Zygotorulaspora mrakii]